MMFSLRLAAACLILVLSAPRTHAQTDSATRAQRIESEVAKWRSALSLTDEQTVKVREIMTLQQAELDRSQAAIESAPEANRPMLATDLENHMHAYDAEYDAVLAPWQCDIARQQGFYDSHVVIILNWWPWWYHWHPFWHHHHPRWWWRHRYPAPFPPRHPAPPQPPIPPRPGPRFDKHGSNEPRREKPQARPQQPRVQPPPQRPSEQPRREQPRQEQPRSEQPKNNAQPNDGPRRQK